MPYGDDPSLSFNVTVNQLDAMFASHIIQGTQKESSEFRVLLIGDSSVWGFLQENEETITSRMNQRELKTPDGKDVRFYNLGFPTLSLTKDLLILDYANRFQPDLILWFITLESLPYQKQLDSPLLQFNPQATTTLIDKHGLMIGGVDAMLNPDGFWERTIIGRRRLLAELFRHQIYGILWTATAVDQHIPESFGQRAEDLEDDLTFQGLTEGELTRDGMAFDVLKVGIDSSSAPVLLVNEPIFISTGENSDIRYNFYYPIWAYDTYLDLLEEEARNHAWDLIDLWDLLPGEVFTDSAIHYDSEGVELVITELLSSPYLSFVRQ
jgi:hypothetical protein